MTDKFLALGSIVTLIDGNAKLNIIGRAPIITNENQSKAVIFDYAACLYPIGLDIENTFYFNQEDVEQIIFEGFSNDDEENYQRDLSKWLESNRAIYTKGLVSNDETPDSVSDDDTQGFNF